MTRDASSTLWNPPRLSDQFLQAYGGQRSSAARSLDLLIANPGRRPVGTVCGEEMGARLDGLAVGKSSATVQSAVLLREEPLWSGGPGMVEFETPAPKARSSKEDLHEISLAQAENRNARTPQNWLERWWSPDPRKAPREKSSGLAAYSGTAQRPRRTVSAT